MRTLSTVVGLLLVIPQPALAARRGAPAGSWSQDGSAEAATLRNTAHAQSIAQGSGAAGQRGVTYSKEDIADVGPTPIAAVNPTAPAVTQPADTPAVVPGPASVAPSVDPAALQRRYDLERIAKRGRSFFIPGVVLATLGTIVLVGGVVGLAKEPNGVTGGITGASLALAGIGWPLLVIGVRMRKHPDRYLDRTRAQASLAPTGLTLRF